MIYSIRRGFILFAYCFISIFISANAADNEEKYSIVGVGDIVIGLNYPEDRAYYHPIDGNVLFSKVNEFISSADFAVGNLEGVLLNKGGTPKVCKDEKYCYLFRMSENYATVLAEAGFDAMSIANNHARDFGIEGQRSTMKTLKKAGIGYAGMKELCETSIIKKDNLRYGFCAFAPNALMVSIHDYEYAKKLVKQLHDSCDVVVVSFHGGAEGMDKNRVPRKNEEYAGESRGDVYKFAHCMIDAGADVVFGHGPHVVRGLELYKNRLIAYSLGNFCTPHRVNKTGRQGYAPVVRVDVRRDGTFISGEILSATQTGNLGPAPDTQKVVIKEMSRLSKLDFPESKLIINDDGTLKCN